MIDKVWRSCFHKTLLAVELLALVALLIITIGGLLPPRLVYVSDGGDELTFRFNESADVVSAVTFGQLYCMTNEGDRVRARLPITFKGNQLTVDPVRIRIPCRISGFEIYFNFDPRVEFPSRLHLEDVRLGGEKIALEYDCEARDKNHFVCYAYHPKYACNGHLKALIAIGALLYLLLLVSFLLCLRNDAA